MVNCLDLLKNDDVDGAQKFNNDKFDLEKLMQTTGHEYLCPANLDEVILEGEFGDEVFRYLKFSFEGCQMEINDCLPPEEITGYYFNFVSL